MSQKLKFVLSDLHIGAGCANREDNPLEDFRADQEFVAFLHEIQHESERDQREIELIINGDFLEFLQVPAVDDYSPAASYPGEAYLDSSQAASVKRLNVIMQGHEEVCNALTDFMHVEFPQRRITVIKGNHDVNLFWPGVKTRLREILGASGMRASLLRFADEFVSRGKIYVEHGHQWAEKMNGYPDSFDPRSSDDPTQLYLPTGSRFVIDYFNEVEREWWFVDHIKPLTTLIWYAFQWNFDFASQALAAFIRHTPALVVDGYAPDTSIIPPSDPLLQDLENENKRREMSQRYAGDPDFRQQLHQKIQQYLSDAIVDNRGATAFPLPPVSDDSLEMGRADQKQQQAMLHQAAQRIANREGAKVILFGHTHCPVQELLENGSLYINTGGWIEDFSEASPETWAALFNGLPQPDHPPHRLPYARIDYDADDNPVAKLLYFEKQEETVPPPSAEPMPEVQAEPKGFMERNLSWIGRFLRTDSQ